MSCMDIRGFSFLSAVGRLRGGGDDADGEPDAPATGTTDTENEETDSGVVRVEGKGSDDGDEVRIPPDADVAISVPDGADVDAENIQSGLTDAAAERAVLVQGQSNEGGSTTVSPVASGSKDKLGGLYSDLYEDIEQGFHLIKDDKINKLQDNRVDYNQRIGKWILREDDRVPAILNQQVALILGQSGIEVEPEDPDNDADVRLAEHLRTVYDGDADADEDLPHVDPGDVVRDIMAQNYMAARSVLRSTDLADLPLDTLTYYRDPEDGREYYLQDETSYQKLVVDDDADAWETERRTTDEQLLELGTHVFDAHLFNQKPLQSVADLVVNKMVLQRLMARKAEIASVGGLYIKVNPPDWLQESEYHDTIPDPENDGEQIKKLELHMREGVNSAFETLEDYQSGFIMSIPSHWEVDQIEVPETGEPMADQIRAYNKSIAARLMFPIDLMELQQGAELSRDSLLTTLLNVISGWRQEILSVFDGFAEVQKDVHNLNGSVTHTLPKLESEDEELVLQALRHAGLAGMTTKEVRQALNRVEGLDLDEQPEGEPAKQQGPQPGGPMDPNEREQSMRDMLGDDEDQQPPSPPEPPEGDEDDDPPEGQAKTLKALYQSDGSDATVTAEAIPEDFGVEVFRVTADPDDDTEYQDSPLGVGVDFPSGGVYIDWNLGAFPDPLDEPHISEYGSVEDFQKASGNNVEYVTDDDTATGAAQFTPPEGLDLYELEGWDQTSVWKAYLSLGASHSTCSTRMTGEVRNPDAWCAALKDSALGTDMWRGASSAPECAASAELDEDYTATLYAADPIDYEYGGSLSDFADHVRAVLEDNLDRDVEELESDDDFVAFTPGGVDPRDADEGETVDDFDPVVIVKTGDGYSVQNASEDDLSGLDDRLNEAEAAQPFDVPDDVAAMSTSELIDGLRGED